MFDKYITEDNSDKAAKIVDRALEKFGRTLKSISKSEIEARDRVDISLKEYEELKASVRRHETRCRKMSAMIIKLGIPEEIIDAIEPDSMRLVTCDNLCDFTKHFRIEFDVPNYHPKV